MRVAVIYFPPEDSKKLLDLSKGLAAGLEAQGHQVDIIDGKKDVNAKLTVYKYIALGTGAINFFGGKIPESVGRFLSNAGMVAGKRCFAFVQKTKFRAEKTLSVLMKTMEEEGMYLKFSDVLTSTEMAKEVGKRLHID